MSSFDKAALNKQIWALTLPTMAALIIEPLLLATDSVFVGRLGAVPLAGLTIASTVLTTTVGLCIFLTYATTAVVARAWGAGQQQKAWRFCFDGLWFGLALGAVLGAGIFYFAPALVAWFGPSALVAEEARAYLHVSALGLPGMLTVIAVNGALRGLGDTKSPFIAASAGAIINIIVSWTLIYQLNWGISGAGAGTAVAQTLMALWLIYRLTTTLHQKLQKSGYHVTYREFLPTGRGVLYSALLAWPLFLRTLSLRAVLVLQVDLAAKLGTDALAAYQLVASVWFFALFGLDALATAAQILIGQALGQGDKKRVRFLLRYCATWSLKAGVVLGLVLAVFVPLLMQIMTSDIVIASLGAHTLWLTCALVPLSSLAFLLDGVLLGAGDTKYLAVLMFVSLLAYLPGAALVYFCLVPDAGMDAVASGAVSNAISSSGAEVTQLGMSAVYLPQIALWGLWLSYGILHMGARALGTYLRLRGDKWMRIT